MAAIRIAAFLHRSAAQQVHLATDCSLQFVLQGAHFQQARIRIRQKLHQQVYVTIRSLPTTSQRPKKLQPRHRMPRTHGSRHRPEIGKGYGSCDCGFHVRQLSLSAPARKFRFPSRSPACGRLALVRPAGSVATTDRSTPVRSARLSVPQTYAALRRAVADVIIKGQREA